MSGQEIQYNQDIYSIQRKNRRIKKRIFNRIITCRFSLYSRRSRRCEKMCIFILCRPLKRKKVREEECEKRRAQKVDKKASSQKICVE